MEDPRPAKRRKPHAAPTAAPTTCRRHTSELRLGQPRPLVVPSTARPEIDDAQPQADDGYSSIRATDMLREVLGVRLRQQRRHALVAEYQEWPFQGFLKRIKIGDDVTYNLEFQLPSTSEQLHLPIDPKALDIFSSKEAPAKVPTHHEAAAHSKIHQTSLQPKKRRVKWTPEDDATLVRMMRNDGCSWEDIGAALPHRTLGTIQQSRGCRSSSSQGSKPSSSDDGGLSDSDSDPSNDDDGCPSEDEQGRSRTSKHSRWSDLDEQCLLAYKEGKSWKWIFGKFLAGLGP
ncbi:hypothetical protein ACEPPN_000420 [Leptodophora sp. 'Broadleaf-Isolate-01']